MICLKKKKTSKKQNDAELIHQVSFSLNIVKTEQNRFVRLPTLEIVSF